MAEKKINKSKKQTKKPTKTDAKNKSVINDLEKKIEGLRDKHMRLKAGSKLSKAQTLGVETMDETAFIAQISETGIV